MAVPKLILRENLLALGWPGITGAVLGLAALVYGLAVLLPADRERQRTHQQALAADRPDTGTVRPPQSAEMRHTDFYRDFPAQTEVTRWIERIYAAAAAEKLFLARGEYLLAPVADTRLTRYQLTFPVRGDYTHIRRFIAAALTAIPNLSVDDLNLQRQNIADPQVEGRIRLSIYLVNRS